MTCIVGIIANKKVYIGGDSAGVDDLNIVIRKDVKVFKVGKFIIGCTTSFRMIQLIRFSFTPPKVPKDKDIYEYMCTDFIDELRKCFKRGGFLTIDNSVESGGRLLVGYQDRLFQIESDFQVGESVDGLDSVGCGQQYAKGALSALKNNPPVERINKTLEIVTHFSGGVRPPFVIETT